MRTASTIATIASIALFARASAAGTCSNSCFSENCDFYVKKWGISCDTAESEYGCSCAGCACEDTEESSSSTLSYSRRTGLDTTASEDPEALLQTNTGDWSFADQEQRRTGNTTNTTSSPTAAPTNSTSTSAPTSAPTTASTTIEQAITTTFPAGVTSSTYAAGTGGYKDLCEAAYGVSLGIYTTSTNTWDTDCAVSSVAASSRRADLTITYTATISAAEEAAATTAASSLDAATLNTNAAAVNTAGTLTVATVPTATVVATATVTTSAPTAAPTGSSFSGASSTSTVSILAFAAVFMAFNRA